jgi:hypothetical protein
MIVKNGEPNHGSGVRMLHRALEIGGEAAITLLFRASSMSSNSIEDRIPYDQTRDTVVYEMALKFGRADIVIFHADGTASVIEVKDGSKGYNHVVSGIGQAALYATQLALKGTVRRVRKCLLWTSTGNVDVDAMVETACEQSETVPLPWGALSRHLNATRELLTRIASEEARDGA